MENRADLEFAGKPLKQPGVENVAHQGRAAYLLQRIVDRADIHGDDVLGTVLSQSLNKAVPHFAVCPGNENGRRTYRVRHTE